MCGHNPLNHIPVYSYPYLTQTGLAAGAEYTPPQVATRPCPQCGALNQEDFVFCPRCGTEILTACPSCHRAAQTDWTHCPYCGTDLLAGKTEISTHSHS
jgi:RNA polymerase subunit RPABC4/transcription elongation factor Spt4